MMASSVNSIMSAINNGSLSNALTPNQTNSHLFWPDMTQQGEPKATLRNAKQAVRLLNIECKFDTFRQRKVVEGYFIREFAGQLTDDCCVFIRNLILETYGFDPKMEHIRDAICALCLENPFHPILEYLDGLTWDRVPRLHKFMSNYFGGADTGLSRVIGRKMMMAAVRRVRQPGCKFDTIVILEGQQGTGKSTAIKILAGNNNFSDNEILTLSMKEQIEMMEGVWIYELGELDGLSRADTSKVKAFASRSVDSSRLAYCRFKEERPRQCILIGTTNDDKYLRDRTGNRRFWPVQTGEIDLAALRRDRDQLWAEAVYWEKLGGELVLPKGLWLSAAAEQQSRLEDDPWGEKLVALPESYIDRSHGDERVKSKDLLWGILDISTDKQQPYHGERVKKLMREIGWDGPKPLRFKDGTFKGYQRPNHSESNLVTEECGESYKGKYNNSSNVTVVTDVTDINKAIDLL